MTSSYYPLDSTRNPFYDSISDAHLDAMSGFRTHPDGLYLLKAGVRYLTKMDELLSDAIAFYHTGVPTKEYNLTRGNLRIMERKCKSVYTSFFTRYEELRAANLMYKSTLHPDVHMTVEEAKAEVAGLTNEFQELDLGIRRKVNKMLWILEQNFRLVPMGIFLSDDAYLEPLPHNWCKRRRAFYGLLVFKKMGY
jgi:hypothetical protein